MTDAEIQQRMEELNKKAAQNKTPPITKENPAAKEQQAVTLQKKQQDIPIELKMMSDSQTRMDADQQRMNELDPKIVTAQQKCGVAEAGLNAVLAPYNQQIANINNSRERSRDRDASAAWVQNQMNGDPVVQDARQQCAEVEAVRDALVKARKDWATDFANAQRILVASKKRYQDDVSTILAIDPHANILPFAPNPESLPPPPTPGIAAGQVITVGSGTAWPIAPGYVATNNHVIAGAKEITLTCVDGTKLQATVAMADTVNDLALLKVDDPKKLPPLLPLATQSAEIGEHVFTIGYPEPDSMGKKPKFTDGAISAMTGGNDDPTQMQISVAIQQGNSGGPLLNNKGEVVGITTLIRVGFNDPHDAPPQNVNYAVKASYLRPLLESVTPISDAGAVTLDSKEADQPTLVKRIEGSVLYIECVK